MMHRLRGSDFRIFTLDTGRLNQETYDCMDAIRARYGVSIEVYFPDALKVQDMVRAQGTQSFLQFCRRAQAVLRRAQSRAAQPRTERLGGLDDRAAARTGGDPREVGKVEVDKDHGGIVKINPLADWSHDEVWHYIRDQ